MKKINELKQMSWRTVHHRDAYGNLVRGTEDIEVYRPIVVVDSGIRFVHLMVDGICFQIAISLVGYFFQLIENFTNFSASLNLTLALITGILTLLSYPALYTFCEYKWQRTPAKFLTRSVVIDEYGNKPELRVVMLRSVIRWVPFEPFSFLGNPSRGWHDRWSNTWVVSDEELATLKKLQAEQSGSVTGE